MEEETATKVLPLAKKIATQLKGTLGCEGLNLVQNNGETAGQTVFHFHMHLIPRYKDDNQKIGWNPTETSSDELKEILDRITK